MRMMADSTTGVVKSIDGGVTSTFERALLDGAVKTVKLPDDLGGARVPVVGTFNVACPYCEGKHVAGMVGGSISGLTFMRCPSAAHFMWFTFRGGK